MKTTSNGLEWRSTDENNFQRSEYRLPAESSLMRMILIFIYLSYKDHMTFKKFWLDGKLSQMHENYG